ncbi:lamin tail domain-containing protein [Pedobacter sp. Hv1]|uniref:lamin tail domain-containing protein n=1 Tax=Pedobacter sp. Hv1 TaxID=1740090 RepID=UPI0006D8D65D|nr:lamin tail domain-containing protein [Pedobacter sp. Hv1]KQC02705.1 hypothetical protein AQF98_03780 [Pedobacter sp. Hv1]
MRKTLLFLMLLSVKLTFGQVSDDFTDGNFTTNPTWLGNQTSFKINNSKQLQSGLSANAQTVTLATANAMALNVKWEFGVQMNFDPTATNQTRIYLIADQQDLNGPLNGYFIQIGESGGTDSYDLYRQTGTTVVKIIDGPPKTRANVNTLLARVKVTRNELGKWEIYTDITGGRNYVLDGTTVDLSFTTTNWFGVYCRYTATRSDGFIFDDFKVEELMPDMIAPSLLSIKVVDEFTVEALFSEGLTSTTALINTNYELSKIGNPTNVVLTNLPNVYKLTFATALSSGDYTLTVNKVTDLKGNEIGTNNKASIFYVKPYLAQKGDIVINEIFADPSPQIGLPNAEFVELWNTTDAYILLNGWKYEDLTSTYTFTSDTLKPKAYLILTANADASAFKGYGKTIGLSTWPSLNNDKDVLKLTSSTGTLIDEVAYNIDWYKDEVKKQGGYSLELIDPNNACKGIQNWGASTSLSGGTPGQQNASYQSQLGTTAPKLLLANIIDDLTIQLEFSKYIDAATAAMVSNYNINNGIGFPVTALPMSPAFTTVELKLASPLVRGIQNVITVNNLSDCAGNLIDPLANTAQIFKAKTILKGDILISEVLVNPKNGGVDFVEVYNQTDHVLDLKELKLSNLELNGSKIISSQSLYMPAKTHWVLTTNPTLIKQNYKADFPNQFVEMNSFPAYNNDKGTVVLLGENGIIDQLDYHEGMHLPLLKNADGVSLERVSYAKPTQEIGNFKSAAAAVGFATPSYRNSQEEDPNLVQNKVNLASKTFSPDGDGFEDLLQINYQFVKNGHLATVNIYTDRGILIRKLERNTSIATAGNFTWDGMDDNGQKSKVGIYVVKFDAFALNGKMESFKQVCVLAAKLN